MVISSSSKKNNIIYFSLVLFVLNLPNLIWLAPSDDFLLNIAEFGARLVQSLLISTVFLLLFSSLRFAWLSAWLLFLWWQPLSIAVRLIAGTPITSTLIGTTAATSFSELSGLFSVIPTVWFIYFILWNIGCFLILRWLSKNKILNISWQFRGKMLFFCLSMLALPYLVLPNASLSKQQETTVQSNPLEQFGEGDNRIGSSTYLPDIFPFELPWAIAQYIQAKLVVDEVRANLQLPEDAYSMNGFTAAAEVVVLVIGESSTRNAWRLFNPDAPNTTPMLDARVKQDEHLFAFKRTLAQTTATRQAVPSLLTHQPLVWPNGEPNPNATLSMVSVAKTAGFSTAWFSNQTAVGKHDGIIATYAHEADVTAFLNPSSYYAQGSYDEVLLPSFNRFITEQKQAFVVLHTMGSHFNYKHRYPSGFGLYPNTNDEREAYFNTVRYTDYLLNEIIESLKKDGRKAVLIYVSDHGESVPQGACQAKAANRKTQDAYEIPALVWLSDSYAQAHPTITTQLSKNQNKCFQSAAVPQTLLDLMRGDNQAALINSGVQSFVRSTNYNAVSKETPTPVWAEKFERAVERNSCHIIQG